jgi:hypothetical protein
MHAVEATNPSRDQSIARPSFADRLLAEAVRAHETADPRAFDDAAACREARDAAGGDFERFIIERARRLDASAALRDADRAVARWWAFGVQAMFVTAVITGVLAAGAALADGVASVFALLGGLLGVQTAMLLLWVGAMILLAKRGGSGAAGRLAMLAIRRGAHAIWRDDAHRAAIEARFSTHMSGAIGRWTLASITHLAWTAVNVGILAHLAVMFIGEGYEFRWDSTWLSDRSYAWLIEVVSSIPSLAGFPTPSADQIAASRAFDAADAGTQNAAAREAWAWLFFGSVVVYGLVPRAALAACSLVLRARAKRRFRLDVDRPEYARLRERMAPPSPEHGHASTAASWPAVTDSRGAAPAARTAGPAAIVGVELSAPRDRWPPPLPSGVHDLGVIDGGADERRVVDALAHGATSPRALAIAVELRRTPDRGVLRIVAALRRAAAPARVHLILSMGRDAGGGIATGGEHEAAWITQRTALWSEAAGSIGIAPDDVEQIDLDNLTARTRERLAGILASRAGANVGGRPGRLTDAFALIARRAAGWSDPVDPEARLTLARDVLSLYGGRGALGDEFAGIRGEARLMDVASITAQARRAADRTLSLLPPSLRVRPAWAAAGAVAGAIGCVAAASLLFPAAIASLPMWSIVGGATGSILSTLRASPSTRDGATAAPADSVIEAVRAHALHAMILELQGLPEERVSTVLGEALGGDTPPDFGVNAFLDDLRDRFNAAARETGP